MSRSIGLDIADTAVRVVELEGSGRKPRLLRYAEREIRSDGGLPWADAAAEAAAALFAEQRLSRENVVAALDASDVLFRLLTFPFRSDDQVRKVVKFEIESQLQNYAADDLVVDYVTVDQNEKGSQVLAAAAPKEVVRARLALLRKAGVDPVALDLDVNALFNAFAWSAGDAPEPFVIAHGGARFTKLVLARHRVPHAARTVRLALGSPAQPKASDKEPVVILDGTSGTAGTAASASPARGPASAHPAAPADAADRITLLGREILRFILSSQSQDAPTRLLLTGDFLRHPDLPTRLETDTNLAVAPADLLEGIDHPFAAGEIPLHLAVPLGLALKGLGLDRSPLDFRKEEFVHQRRYARITKTLITSACLVTLFLILIGVHLHWMNADWSDQLQNVLAAQQRVFEDAFPDRKGKVGDRERIVQEMERIWREDKERVATPLPESALGPVGILFDKLRDLLGQQTADGRNKDFYIALDLLNYNVTQHGQGLQGQGLLDISGQISSPPLAEALQNALKAVLSFESVQLSGLAARPDGRYGFNIKIVVKKSTGGP